MKRVKQDSAKLVFFIVGSEPTHTLFSQNSPQHLLVVAAPTCQRGVLPFYFSIHIFACDTEVIFTTQKYISFR